jgi:hypothetical protein
MTDITFSDFQSALQSSGLPLVAEVQGKSAFFVKTANKVKVDLNKATAPFSVVVAANPKALDSIVPALEAAGNKLVKRPKGWAVFEFSTLDSFFATVKMADELAGPMVKQKVAKLVKQKVTLPKVTALTDEGKAKVKEANKAKMAAVMARLKKAKDSGERPSYDEVLDPNAFDVPAFLTKDDVKALV